MQPALGMFLSRDPWSGDELHPGALGGRTYAGGNPINSTDSTGYCPNCVVGSFARVFGANKDGGLKLRKWPSRSADNIIQVLRDDFVVMVMSAPFRSENIDWRIVDTPFAMGVVAHDYLKPAFGPPSPPLPPPPVDLSGFKLGPFFKSASYKIVTPYGSSLGYQQWLPDLQRNGHGGVDLVPVPEVDPLYQPCANNISGREVIAPVQGTMAIYNPDVCLKRDDKNNCIKPGRDPETNPPGITLDISEIPSHPYLEVQLTHVYPQQKAGPVQYGATLGVYAQIGYSGKPHLHLSLLLKGKDGTYAVFDPSSYLP